MISSRELNPGYPRPGFNSSSSDSAVSAPLLIVSPSSSSAARSSLVYLRATRTTLLGKPLYSSTTFSSGSSGLGKLFGSTSFVGLLARAKPRSSDSAVSAVKWLINYLIWFRGLNTAAGLYSAIVPFEIESHISSYETRHHLPFSGIMKE